MNNRILALTVLLSCVPSCVVESTDDDTADNKADQQTQDDGERSDGGSNHDDDSDDDTEVSDAGADDVVSKNDDDDSDAGVENAPDSALGRDATDAGSESLVRDGGDTQGSSFDAGRTNVSTDDETDAALPSADASDAGSLEGGVPPTCEDFINEQLEGSEPPPAPPPLSPAALHTFSAPGKLVLESCAFMDEALSPFDTGEPDAPLDEPDAEVGVHSDPETGLDLLVVTRMSPFSCGSAGCSVYVYVDAGAGYELAGWVTAQVVEGTMHFGGLLSLVFWQRGEEGPDAYPFVYRIETSGPSPELVYFGPLAG